MYISLAPISITFGTPFINVLIMCGVCQLLTWLVCIVTGMAVSAIWW